MPRIDLVIAPKSCKKCEACKALVDEIVARYPGQIMARVFDTNAEEAARYGVVLPPTMVLDDFIVAVGSVPRKDALLQLVEQRLGQSEAGRERCGVVEVRAAEFDEAMGCEPMMLFWYVEEGAHVAEGQELCEIESAKAVFVIQAPATGKLCRIHVKEGDAVESGHLLAEIEPAA